MSRRVSSGAGPVAVARVVWSGAISTTGATSFGSTTTDFTCQNLTANLNTNLNNQCTIAGTCFVGSGGNTMQIQGVAAANLTWGASSTSVAITQSAAAGAAATTTITAQAAGGTNDGGPLALGGGAHSGSSKADGSVQITTPLNAGQLTFNPSAGANALTNAQSNANVILCGVQASAFTLTFLREIADKSLLFIRNPSGNGTATIAYISGGTVTVAAATSALIVSDGSNLQKIMVGT